MKTITINTTKRNEMIDITSKVESFVEKDCNAVVVFVPHTTAGVTINENADPSVESDMLRKLSELIPKNDGYDHLEGNSDSHLKASFFGSSVHVIVEEDKLVLGTWQGIFFCEFDGPRTRKVFVKCI
ncbi:MAG: secondary thiamine-phosphate synthase enzyme YjbQ [Candidatus Woesearchaeota archaeon]